MNVSVVLFTSDLRLHDHPPLRAALDGSRQVVPLFVRDYQHGWITIVTSTLVIVVAAWVARWIAIRLDSWQSVRTLRKETTRLE